MANGNVKFGLQLELDGDKLVIQGLDGTRTAVSNLDREVDNHSRTTTQAAATNKTYADSFTSLRTQAKAFSGVLAAMGVYKFVSDLYDVNAETQRLQASLVTVTGSQRAAAAAWEELEQFATSTPYQLEQSVNAFIKMQALGLDPTIPKLRSLGNTASAMGKDLTQMIEAVADASTGEFERLKEFGIKASSEGDKVRFTFQGVTTEVKKSAEDITQYLTNIGDTEFAGAMERQMDTLSGAMSNLGDNVDALFRAIGESGGNAGLSGAINWLSESVQSLTDIIDGTSVASLEEEIVRVEAILETGGNRRNRTSKSALEEKLAGLREELLRLKASGGELEAIQQVIASLTTQIDELEGSNARGRNKSAVNERLADLNAQLIKYKALLEEAKAGTDDAAGSEDKAGEAVSRTTQALLDKIAVIETENQLLALGYDLEDAKFTAAYTHADELTQALMRQQATQKALLDLRKAEADLLDDLSAGNDADIQDAIDKQNELNDAVKAFTETSFESNAFEAFDDLGLSLYGVADALEEMAERQEKYNDLLSKGGLTAEQVADIQRQHAEDQISAYGDITGAAKTFFDKGSKGYKALEAAEKSFRAVEIGLAVANLGEKLGLIGTETAAVVSAAATKATAEGTAAVASSAVGLPFPGNLAAMAATIAALASMGVLLNGSAGGSGGGPTANYNGSQGVTGSATVLGDRTAQSESISNSIDLLADILEQQLTESVKMASSLAAIEASMVGLNAELGELSGKRDQFGITGGTIGDVLAGADVTSASTRVTRELGIQSAQEAIAYLEAYGDGLDSWLTENLEKIADINFGSAVQDTIAGIVDTALEGFNLIGLDATNMRDQIAALELPEFNLRTGGLSPEELQDEIAGFFGSVGDSIVGVMAPSIQEFQRAGEGLLETLTRVAAQTVTLQDLMETLGTDFGVSQKDINLVADNLSLLSGEVSDFSGNVADFLDLVLTEAEQFDRLSGSVATMFAAIDTAVPQSRASLQSFVASLDLNTEAGQRAFTVVTSATDLLNDYYDALEERSTAAYDFGTEFGLNDGLDALRTTLSDIGLSFDVVETLASQGRDSLNAWAAGLTEAQQAALEPFTDQIIALIPEAVAAAEAIEQVIDTTALQIRLLQAEGDQAGATALRRQQELDAASDVERAYLLQIYAAEDLAQANAAAVAEAEAVAQAEAELAAERDRIAQEAYGLQTQLLQLQGDTTELRRRELEQLDPANRALQEQIWALQDSAAATQAAADNEAELAAERDRIAQEAYGLQTRLLQLQGDTESLRARELELLDPVNRALQEHIWALEDQAEANATAAAEAERIAQAEAELAAERDRIAQEAYGLQTQLLQLQGDTAELRARELAQLDPANRALQEFIWSLEDQAAATQAAVEAEAELQAQRDAIAQEAYGLQTQLLQLQGDTAALRARELAQLDPANRALQEFIWSLEDQAEANAAAAAEAERIAQAEAELAAERDRIAQEAYGLQTQLLQLQGDTAALRARELEQLDPANRALQELIWSLEDQATATQAAADAEAELQAQRDAIAQEAYGLQTQLLQVQGDTAALRARELEQLDPANRALQELIWSLEDQAAATQAAADAEAELQARRDAIAQEAYGLQTQLLQLQGDTTELRARELAQLDPANRALQELIWSLEDQAAATQAAADAEAELQARRDAIAQEAYGLQTQLLQVQGDTAALRARELEQLDPANRALQELIWSLEDQAEANAAAAAEAERIAQAEAELAAERDRIAQEAYGLQTQLLQLQGNTAELRRRELEQLDPANRALQELIWSLEDQAAATQAAADAEAELQAQRDAIAQEAYGLQTQLLQLQGDTTELRARELAQLDPANRAMQELIWSLEDQAAATQAAADAEAELQARRDAIAQEAYGLQTQLLQLQGDTAELRARELAQLDPANRALQELIWSLEDQATATQAAAEAEAELQARRDAIAQEAYGLQTQLLQVQGDTAALRARELEQLDPANRALQEFIWSLEDQATATQAAAEAEAELQAQRDAIAQEAYGLQTQLLQLQGDTAELRARELAQLDPANRALQEFIWSLEDQATATQAAAEAEAELQARRDAIAQEAYGLQTQLLQLQGNTAALRARELAQLDPTNRAIQLLIWRYEDQQAAAEAAAQAEAELAARRDAIAQEAYGLQTQLLQLQGNTAALRARELEQLDPTNRALQQRIWKLEDQQAAADAYQDALNDQITSLQHLVDLSDDLRRFVDDIQLDAVPDNVSLDLLQRRFADSFAAIQGGDLSQIDQFKSLGSSLVDVARSTSTSELEYLRIVAGVTSAATDIADELAANTPDLTVAQQQLNVLQGIELSLNEPAMLAPLQAQAEVARETSNNIKSLEGKLDTLINELRYSQHAIASSNGDMANNLRKLIGSGQRLRVLITNTDGEPVYTAAV